MGANILLALGALAMFGTFLGSSNRLMLGNSQIASQNEYYIAALSYAQSVIEEAKTKAFGEEYVSEISGGKELVPLGVSEETIVYHLGIETLDEKVGKWDILTPQGYKSEIHFDDVDDYNSYSRMVNSRRAEGYRMVVTVQYVADDDPNTVRYAVTNSKKMMVSVTSPYFPKTEKDGQMVPDTVRLSYIFTK